MQEQFNFKYNCTWSRSSSTSVLGLGIPTRPIPTPADRRTLPIPQSALPGIQVRSLPGHWHTRPDSWTLTFCSS
eukprot:849510-Rhodomonas_salina.2